MIQIIQLTINQRKLEIVYDAKQLYKLPSIKFDKRRLQQVLLNLLSNAVKFTSKGIVTVSTLVIETTQNNYFLEITVEDEGIGLTREDA